MAMSPGLRSWHPLPPLPSSPHPSNRWRRHTSPLALPNPHLPTISTFHLELAHPATKSQPHWASSHSIHSRLAFGANGLGFCISDYSLHFGENGSHDCLQENTFGEENNPYYQMESESNYIFGINCNGRVT